MLAVKANPSVPPKKLDAALSSWISLGGKETKELIVEAHLPSRRVSFDVIFRGRPRPTGIREEVGGRTRSEVLSELKEYLTSLIGVEPVLLSSAGSLAIEANADQVASLLGHPMVKSIHLNRQYDLPARSAKRD